MCHLLSAHRHTSARNTTARTASYNSFRWTKFPRKRLSACYPRLNKHKMGCNNNAATPRTAWLSFVHLFFVLSLTGIGAFTAASSYLSMGAIVGTASSTHAREMVKSFGLSISGGATAPSVGTIHQSNDTDHCWNDTSAMATFAAGTITKNKGDDVGMMTAPTLCTEFTAETETFEKEEVEEIPELRRALQKAAVEKKGGPLKVLFLSADTGGGHRASAESLAKQFQIHYPGSTYDLLDVWTADGVYPYKTLVKSYQHLSAHPRQWKFLYHISNTRPYEIVMNFHSTLMCERRIRRRIASYDPDVVVSVHPTMNYAPGISVSKISQAKGKHIPFFTVITDYGSAHSTWYPRQSHVEKLYIASERIRKLAKKRGRTPDENLVMSGLPIRHDFAVQAENMGDRTTTMGKLYQKAVREDLGINTEKHMVLVMGGGEGVGSLSDIVNELYTSFSKRGIDATICVVCGRNEKLRKELRTRDWESVVRQKSNGKPLRRRRLSRLLGRTRRSREMQESLDRAVENEEQPHPLGKVDVVGLGFVTNMAEYMVAADALVSKAGPGTIAEAAAVGLPIMLTSFLPGQEAGNVDVVLDGGFGDYNSCPEGIAAEVACWLQDDELLDVMSHCAQEAGHPHAASDIILDIGERTHTWMRLNSET